VSLSGDNNEQSSWNGHRKLKFYLIYTKNYNNALFATYVIYITTNQEDEIHIL